MSPEKWAKVAVGTAITIGAIGGYISYKVAKWAINDGIDIIVDTARNIKETFASGEEDEVEMEEAA